MRLVIFEDAKCEQLYPIALTRPVFELKSGMMSLGERIRAAYPGTEVSYFMRDWLVPVFKQRNPSAAVNDMKSIAGDDLLLVNGRCLADGPAALPGGQDSWSGDDEVLMCGSIGAGSMEGFSGGSADELAAHVRSKATKVDAGCRMIEYPWDLVNHNAELLAADFQSMGRSGIEGTMADSAVIYGPSDQLYVGKGAEIHPLVCLDTNGGPIVIEEGAEIHPFSRIEGPCYIGKGSIVLGAKVREGCHIGPVCRVGGEIEESIMHAYSNKYHDGFLGHAYVGEWVNLGALTTNSDLKNDYGTVSVMVKGRPVDTGSTKVGFFIGDHAKTSIGVYFNTGSSVGVLCVLVATGGVMPKYLPSGTWFVNGTVSKGFGVKALLRTAEIVMGRRKVKYTEADEQLLMKVCELAKPERDVLIRRARRG